MHTVILPIIIAAMMPFVLTGIAKVGAFSMADNHRTRDWQQALTGYRQRAHWAHQNSFEAFPLFAAAAILAGLMAPRHTELALFAWGFIGARVAYAICYLQDNARLRSVMWFVGTGCIAGLFFIAGTAPSL